MIKKFSCGLCSDEVGDNDNSVQCDLCNKWNHTRLMQNDMKNLKKIHCPGTVQTVQWKYLSQLYLIKA